MLTPQLKFTVRKSGDLRISCKAHDKKEIKEIDWKLGTPQALVELTESYWTNGWGVHTADQLNQMSECEVIAMDSSVEDDGSITLCGTCWYHPNYMVENIIDVIVEKGFIDLPCWQTFDNPVNFGRL